MLPRSQISTFVVRCLDSIIPLLAISKNSRLWLAQGGHWSGKSQGNLIFLQGQGKVKKNCKLVREILNTKKVREKSGNFIILAQNMCCSRYFDYLKCEKSVDFLKVLIFFSRLLYLLEAMKTC